MTEPKNRPDNSCKYWNETLETMPHGELEKLQLERLKEMVAFAYENAPYYKRSFDAAGVKPEDIQSLADLPKESAPSWANYAPYQKKM